MSPPSTVTAIPYREFRPGGLSVCHTLCMERSDILAKLRAHINVNGHIVGAVAGSGMAARFVSMAGIDFILALSAGRFRIAGRGSYASYFCYGNSNELVMDYGSCELLPLIRSTPVLFGLFANDPFINLADYVKQIKERGFSGVVNYPTISLIDGQFREALEEDNNTFGAEVEAIRIAHENDLFTVAFVTNAQETRLMLEAGADVICAHLGLTRGGYVGGHAHMPISQAERIATEVFKECEKLRPDTLRMVYSGPASTPIDMQYLYDNTACQGYIGGSVFDRIPSEQAILDAAIAFKSGNDKAKEARMRGQLTRSLTPADYVDFVKKYIVENYSRPVHLRDIALSLHLSYSHVSTLFSRETGCTFTQYLIRFRMNTAKEMFSEGKQSVREVARAVGYPDPAQFSRIFKQVVGCAPSVYAQNIGNGEGNTFPQP